MDTTELHELAKHYPNEVDEVLNIVRTKHGAKLWACRRLNEIRGMFGLYQIQWPVEEEPAPTPLFKHQRRYDDPITVTGPSIMEMTPRYTMLEGEPLKAHFFHGHVGLKVTENVGSHYAKRLLGGKVRWELETRSDGRQWIRLAIVETGTVTWSRALF